MYQKLSAQIETIKKDLDNAAKGLRSAVKAVKREFFDKQIAKVHKQKIWDMVEWTKPRRMDATIGLRKPGGDPVETSEELAEVFQEQFTPANPRPVDRSILEEFDQMPERSFAPISAEEVVENLRECSNMSAPGPDRVSWYWLGKPNSW